MFSEASYGVMKRINRKDWETSHPGCIFVEEIPSYTYENGRKIYGKGARFWGPSKLITKILEETNKTALQIAKDNNYYNIIQLFQQINK